MSIVEDYLKLVRKDEYDAEEAKANALNEAAEEINASLVKKREALEFPLKKEAYKLALTKAVITECVSRLYMKSLIIENADSYKDALMPVARKEILGALSESTTMDELHAQLENASPYVKAMFSLAEAVTEDISDDEVKAFDKKVILDKDDLKLINAWEKDNSQDVYAGAIQDRIVDVYKDEEEASQVQKEKVQTIVDEMNKMDDVTMEEAVNAGANMFDSVPVSVFNAIYVNKSRAIINESNNAGLSVADHADDILCETICTYTLLECIHSLGIKTYSEEDKIKLIDEFNIG